MTEAILQNTNHSPKLKDYINLCKPRVVGLMILTAIITMLIASPTGYVPWKILLFGSIGIALAACSGGVINQLIDHKVDAIMARTKNRPLPSGRVKPIHAILIAACLGAASMGVLLRWVNPTAAVLSFATLIAYAFIYTIFLKRATPQNIVIGGLAGAMPPLLGWTAVTGQIDGTALLLVLIIFTWTPPHFWALAIARHKEYEKANIPMLPVTHGLQYTRLNILLYTVLMVATTYLPFVIDMTGLVYFVGITLLNIGFIFRAIKLFRSEGPKQAMATFHYSIVYLSALFLVLLLDHFYPILT